MDGGCTTLLSPNFDINGALQAFFSYHRWYGEGGNSTDDVFSVDVSNDGGESWVPLERVPDIDNTWRRVSFNVGQFVPMTGSLQFRFVACDFDAGGLVEAAIDDVRLELFLTMPMDAPDARIPARVELAQIVPTLSDRQRGSPMGCPGTSSRESPCSMQPDAAYAVWSRRPNRRACMRSHGTAAMTPDGPWARESTSIASRRDRSARVAR